MKQQQELLDLQNSVQKYLQMIQKKLKHENPKIIRKNQGNTNKMMSSVSCYKNLASTPDKVATAKACLLRSKSGTGLCGKSNYKKRTNSSQSFIASGPGYVDYSEVINDCGSNFSREVTTPVKKVVNKSICKNDGSARRTRAMRSHVVSKEPTNRCLNSTSSVSEAKPQNKTFKRKRRNNQSFISYHPKQKELRSNTPFMNRKTNKTPNKNNISV